MNNSPGRQGSGMTVRDFLDTAWPAISAGDSDLQRRKKMAVRCAQLAMAAMVAAQVIVSLITNSEPAAYLRQSCLLVASPVYIFWCLYGMRDVVRRAFCSPREEDSGQWQPRPPFGAVIYFTVQISLAAGICYASANVRDKRLAWLVLLPPIAHSVILLRWTGVMLVTSLNVAVLAGLVVFWYGWKALPNSLLAFSFAVLFTLVFTLLSASSERSRLQMEKLAGELGEANARLRQHAVQVEELSVTRERNRLAREIHDSLGHYLTVVNVQIEAARTLWDQDPVRARDALAKAQTYTREGLQDIRRSVATLRASPLDNKTLVEALQQIVAENNGTGLPAELRVLGKSRALSSPVELTLYRAGQEGLTNVRKHAQARNAGLVLNFETATEVCLTVSDNGIGAEQNITDGFGLLGLRERAQLLGGEIKVQTSPGAGFTLGIKVPG